MNFASNILFLFILILFSCNDKKSSDNNTDIENGKEDFIITFKEKIPDTAHVGILYKNFLFFKPKKMDSIYKNSLVGNNHKKRAKFLFIETYDDTENVYEIDESNSAVYPYQEDTESFEFYYSFKKSGWNKLTIVVLDRLYMPSDQDNTKLRLLEDRHKYKDSVFVIDVTM